ncbi:MAG: hypothetical protein ACTHMS_16170 [Jatrophihabitans sp.]|uniref:hypothetical protein n=1 Tax=Jatrophihabitans sp. TaxID=1932789 RepID=UPI003F7E81E2
MFWVIPIMAGLIALAGLVLDGGDALAAHQHATDLAQQAARAAADALPQPGLRGALPGDVTPQASAATLAARRILDTADVTGTVDIAGDTVTVTVTVHQATQILSLVGIGDLTSTATATATALHGTTSGDQS